MRIRLVLLALCVLVLLATAHVTDARDLLKKKGRKGKKGKKKGSKGSKGSTTKYTMASVAQHSSPGNCWTVVNKKVYNVSKFRHPGGSVINSVCGKDASSQFKAYHKAGAISKVSKYQIGTL